MKELMSAYKDKYQGSPSGVPGARPAAVLGGGPSLPGDMARLENISPGARLVLIAVNYHAPFICDPDFMVYNDAPDSDPRLLEAVRSFQGVKVSPDPTSDIEFDVPVWTGSYSSNTATWFALWMGCDPVILCGMDCYQGERVYFHEYSHDSPAFHYPLEDQLRPWKEDGKNLLPHVERVRVMSGPLTRVFPRFEGGRDLPLPLPTPLREAEAAGKGEER